MSDVKRFVLLMVGVIGLFALCALVDKLSADTGWEGAVRTENGQNLNSNQMFVSTFGVNSATTIIPTSTKVACVKIRNHSSSFNVYVGSSTGVNTNTGFKIFTSTSGTLAELNLNAFTGAVFGLGDGLPGATSCTTATCPQISVATCGTNQ